jgi:hypothetical protein
VEGHGSRVDGERKDHNSVSAVVISNNATNLWHTLAAMVAVFGAMATGFGWLNRKIAKKSDIQKLSEELADVKDGNTKENTRIIAVVEELKGEVKRSQLRLDRHIEFGNHARNTVRNPLDGVNDE